jgi:hypothetical protein
MAEVRLGRGLWATRNSSSNGARAAAVLGAVLAAPARGDEARPPSVDPMEFSVSWPELIGREVFIPRGRVSMASEMFMLYALPGGNVTLYPPWKDREDLRHIFKYCTGMVLDEDPLCELAVSGTVEKMAIGGGAELKGVDFYKPAK